MKNHRLILPRYVIATIAAAFCTYGETSRGEDVFLGTENDAENWKITGAGAINAPAFQINTNRTGAISITNNALGTGDFVSGGTLGDFDGFWFADRTFILPQNASSISLSFDGLYGNDRVVLILNGSIIGDATRQGATGRGVMSFPPGPPDIQYTIRGRTSGTVTSGFKPGTNTLRMVVNNTGVVPISAPTATFVSPTADGTTAFVDAVLNFDTSGPAAFPSPRLINVRLDPAYQDGACQFNGTLVHGPALGTAILEASLSLGIADSWVEIAAVGLDSSGSAVFQNILDSRPISREAPLMFFRVSTEVNR